MNNPPHTMPEAVVLFDGYCVLCNKVADEIIAHNKKKRVKLAALQTDAGQRLAQYYGIDTALLDSFLLIKKGKALSKADAGLELLRLMSRYQWLYYLAKPFPRSFRNWVYDGIARIRYRWFGKKDSCRIPSPEDREHFLSGEELAFFLE